MNKHYVAPAVWILTNYDTKQRTVKGLIGIADSSEEIIQYPFQQYSSGYWNKGTARKEARLMRQRVKAALREMGLMPTEEFSYREQWY